MPLDKLLLASLIIGLVLPNFCLAQEEASLMPQTVTEAKNFVVKIITALPGAVKKVWQEEAMPFLSKMWNRVQPQIDIWWQKLLNLIGKETPDLKEEFQKEKEEIQQDLWQRFKDLLD